MGLANVMIVHILILYVKHVMKIPIAQIAEKEIIFIKQLTIVKPKQNVLQITIMLAPRVMELLHVMIVLFLMLYAFNVQKILIVQTAEPTILSIKQIIIVKLVPNA